jgi:hypothetical protein
MFMDNDEGVRGRSTVRVVDDGKTPSTKDDIDRETAISSKNIRSASTVG